MTGAAKGADKGGDRRGKVWVDRAGRRLQVCVVTLTSGGKLDPEEVGKANDAETNASDKHAEGCHDREPRPLPPAGILRFEGLHRAPSDGLE